MKGKIYKIGLMIMALSMMFGATCGAISSVSASTDAVSTFDDGYELNSNWIWADTDVYSEQWVSMRKTFTLDEVPNEAFARISADTKYWMWINGQMAIFEGQLKLGDSRYTWYYDKEDISDYLVEGENTIAVQVYYSGKTSCGTINTGVPAFLFEANIGNTLVCSDTTWKAVLDPAYEDAGIEEHAALGESSVRYNANKEMIDADGNKWTDKVFDDSAWGSAVNQDEKIKVNQINNAIYYQKTDPRRRLVLRSIPQWYIGELNTYTSDGKNGTGTYVNEGYSFVPLSLPSEYVLEAEVIVAETSDATIGICVCVQDYDHFYMPQISLKNSSFNGVRFISHIRNGGWSTSTTDLTNTDFGKTVYDTENGVDNRFETKHTIKIEVAENHIKTYMNGVLVGTISDTTLAREGTSIGFRQDRNELLYVYSMKVTDTSGNELYNADIDSYDAGDNLREFTNLYIENSGSLDRVAYNTVAEDNNGEKYVAVRNCRVGISKLESTRYTITNETNQQGTPYIKVKSKNGGDYISIVSDSNNDNAILHNYITKAGEQSWEALEWMNGYVITFTVPSSVEVLELGFRPSGYKTTATGSVTTDNDVINQIYKEAYDTLYICMRDTYMDCPDRERTQWWGDTVSNMQQAAYVMDEDAALLYAKTLKQAIGFVKQTGAIPSKIASPKNDLELPTQSLAGVHSFWQYYLYYGDDTLLLEAYPILLDYLKLWNVSKNGVVEHRSGDWDWLDWGSNCDQAVFETSWYYVALEHVLKIANLEDSAATEEDIEFLTSRMEIIKLHFDSLYWDESKNAYYNSTDNSLADDRANAMAVYSGLADKSRYAGILSVLTSTYNASPYMEKYVLESMYLMGAADEAIARTLERYTVFAEDGYPTLPEQWKINSGTKNHAWTGGPLSLLYMYNAGITPTGAGFETIQIRPQLGTLNSVSATVERAVGKIIVNVEKRAEQYVMSITIPDGVSGGVIYIPRLKGLDTMVTMSGTIVYSNGSAITTNMPTGVSYVGEDEDFIGFYVPAGSYNLTSERNTVVERDSYDVTLSVIGKGSITVNNEVITSTYKTAVYSGEAIKVVATPDENYRLIAITGSYAETIISETSTEKSYTINSDTNLCFVFEENPVANKKLQITATDKTLASYALSVYVNDKIVSLPYVDSYPEGGNVTITAEAAGQKNYTVTINGKNINKTELSINDDTDVVIDIIENSTVNLKPISTVVANISSANTSSWSIGKIYDGSRISSGSSNGFSSGWKTTSDISSNPYILTFDLGSVQTINQVAMFPRSNSWTADPSLSCNYPVDFTISVSENGNDYVDVVVMKNALNPKFKQQCYSFNKTEARYVRLTVTKLGIPAYDDGTENNHYRLQLAEFEVYYNSLIADNDVLSTPYGTINSDYADSEKYPFALFMNGEFKGAYTHWANTDDNDTNHGGTTDNLDVIQQAKDLIYGTDGAGKTVQIFLRRNYTLDSTEYAVKDGIKVNENYYNWSQIGGTLVVDLNGRELTAGKESIVYAECKTTYNTFVKFINGTVNLGVKSIVQYRSTTSLTASKNFDVAFENVKFVLGDTHGVSIIGNNSLKASVPVKANIDFVNCTFDYSDVSANNAVFSMFNLNSTNLNAIISIKGGKIVTTAAAFSNITIADTAIGNSVTFVADDNENYTKLYMPKGDTTNKTISTNSGVKAFVLTGADEYNKKVYNVYTPSEGTLNSYTPKTSITLGSELVYNVYVPVVDCLKSYTVDGNTYGDAKIVTLDDGNQYYLVSVPMAASRAARNIVLKATITIDGKDYNGTWTMSIPKYAKKVIEYNKSEEEVTLVKDVLAYIKAAYIYFDAEDKAEATNVIDEILGDYNSAFIKTSGETNTENGLEAVVIVLDAKPSIRFVLPEGVTADNYTFKSGNTTLAYITGTTTIGDKTHNYAEVSLYAYQLIKEITYSDGTNSGTWHINSYYDFVTTDDELKNDANLIALVEKLYNYCKSAETYRASVTSK